nr:MAG TPA: hypothetical protein [Caudoviricetes sp.]
MTIYSNFRIKKRALLYSFVPFSKKYLINKKILTLNQYFYSFKL